ncbi:MAG: magnesium/cobalt transporter CorA [Sphingobacteriaceae bacterium]
MIKKAKRIKEKKKRRYGPIGAMPGTIGSPDNALKPVLYFLSYHGNDLLKCQGSSVDDILSWVKRYPEYTHWIQVKGQGNTQFFEALETKLQINRLVIEDILSNHQRPKFEDYGEYNFSVSRLLLLAKEEVLENYQISMILKDKLLISFQETYDEYFEAVIDRIKGGKGIIRTAGPGYLAYALTDTALDRYFALLMRVGDELDLLEDALYENPDKRIMYNTQQYKRTLISLRRAVWPERDKINEILRTENAYFTSEVKVYLKDAYDHCVQLMDLIESYREITSSIIDMYLSMISNRMNEIMKVLTIISSIFIPLTFIAGVYGMNFSREDPSGRILPDNMPELYMRHGYLYTLIVMLIIGLVQVVIFWRKGWFSKL